MDRSFDVAVIGAGASGVLSVAHLQRLSPEIRLALVDAGARAARGLAYGTPYGAHLLNVPASNMSAFADDPNHFLRWLRRHGHAAHEETYAPRPVYGEYLSDLLSQATTPPARVSRIGGTAVGLTPARAGWRVHLQDGTSVLADAVVLALGNLPPADPFDSSQEAPAGYLRDPWTPGVALGLDPAAPVLMIGTGLTMIDTVLTLRAEGHRGPLHAISRRGQLPRAHARFDPRPLDLTPNLASPRAATRWVRREVAAAAEAGGDWRSVIDSLRPHIAAIWGSWTIRQRASFLRHARSHWDVLRHRAAAAVAAEIETLRAESILTIHRGRIESLEEEAAGIQVRWRRREDGAAMDLLVGRVINCTGPASDYASVDLPLVVQLRRGGWLVPDPLRLGIETDREGRVLGRDLVPVPGLFTIGPLRRPRLWESTAIPEIREQAADLARQLVQAKQGSRQEGPSPH